MLTRVLLPQPEGPISTVRRSDCRPNEQSSRTCWRSGPKPKLFPRSFTSSKERLASIDAISDLPLPRSSPFAKQANCAAGKIAGDPDACHADDDLRVVTADIRSPSEIAKARLAGDHLGCDHDVPSDAHADRHAGDDTG